MKKFNVTYHESVSYSVDIEAETEEQAQEIFLERLADNKVEIEDTWDGEFDEITEIEEVK